MAKVAKGYDSAHFLIEAEGFFVFRVAAEIEIFDSVFAAERANESEGSFADSFSAKFGKKIEGLDIERIFILENQIAGFFVIFGDEKDEVFAGINPFEISGIVKFKIEIIDNIVRIDSAVGG